MTRAAACGLTFLLLVGAALAQKRVAGPPDGGDPGLNINTGPRTPRPVYTQPGPPKPDRHGDPLPAGAVARYGTTRLRHGVDISGIGFTPDGKRLCTVSGSADSVKLWDPVSGKEVGRLDAQPQFVTLARDGSVWVVEDARVRVWLPAANTTRTLPDKTIPEGQSPTALAAAPDGRSFALGFENKVLILDAQTGKPARELNVPGARRNPPNARGNNGPDEEPHGPPPSRLVFSPDGRWLLGSGQRTGVWLWDLRTGKRIRTYRTEIDHPEFTFSPDVTRIAITGQRMHLYALDSEEPVAGFKTDEGQQGQALFAPRFSADGKTLFAVTNNGTVQPFDAATGERKDELPPPDENLRPPFALSPDATLAAGVDSSGGIRIWNPETGKGPEVDRLPALAAPGFAPDGKTVSLVDQNNKVHTFAADTGAPGKSVQLPGEDIGLPAAFDPATRLAAVVVPSGDDLELQVLDADTGKVVARHTVAQEGGVPRAAFAAGNRDRLALFAQDGVTVLNPTTGKTVRTIAVGGNDNDARGNAHGTISPDGRVVAADGSAVTLWEVATGKKRLTVEALTEAVAFSADSRLLAGWDDAGNAVVADARTGAVVRRFTQFGTDGALAFSRNGKLLAVGGPDGRVTILDVASGDLLAPFGGHDGTVTGLAFSRDGKRLVSTAEDGTALVWDVPDKPLTVGPTEAAVAGFAEALALLGSADAAQAQRGLDYLYKNPADAAKQVGERVPAPAPTPAATIAKHIDGLAADEFPDREAARKALEGLGGEAAAALRQAAEKSASPQVRKTAAELLDKLEAPATRADELRLLRAVEAMEHLGTPAARAVLDKWAAGPPGHRLTTEATAALARLKAAGK
jgi:WD40 repeat protein